MSTLTDSVIMSRRGLLRLRRYPSMTLMLIGFPIIFLLLFVYVFGDTMGRGLGGVSAGRSAYLSYVAPALLVMAVASAAQGTAISIAMDMNEGVIARFRTMPIGRSAVLVGHVFAAMVQSVVCILAVGAVALLIGYRIRGGIGGWLGGFAVLLLASFALTWLSLALGLVADSVETASNTPMILTLLPFLGSGFVATDTLPVGIRWFAQYQPFTPIIDSVRGLLDGNVSGSTILQAVLWCVALSVIGYAWARHRFVTRPIPN